MISLSGMLLILWTTLPAMGVIPGPIVTYTVTTGDSLFMIANKFRVQVTNLQKSNSLQSSWIIPGEVLIIPSLGSLLQSYTVQNGDSLFLIASKYGVSVADLMYENNVDITTITHGQVLTVPAPTFVTKNGETLQRILTERAIDPTAQIQIVVDKSSHTLTLFADNTLLKSYPVALGDGGPADKQVQGDHKTPEGFFYIVDKTILEPADEFLGTRWIRLGYPVIEDAVIGIQHNIINQSEYQAIITAFSSTSTPPQYSALGGGVGIHGGDPGTGNDWTWGCLGLADQDIKDFFRISLLELQ